LIVIFNFIIIIVIAKMPQHPLTPPPLRVVTNVVVEVVIVAIFTPPLISLTQYTLVVVANWKMARTKERNRIVSYRCR
jgi:hypothetical protein